MNRSDDYIMGGGSGSAHDSWKRVFDEASEPPPPRVWDAVERQLDLDDEDGIIPLWQHHQGQQSMLFGRWTAGIAASLLLTLFGWWAWHRGSDLRPAATPARQVAVAPQSATAEQPAQPTEASPQPTRTTQAYKPAGEALASRTPVRTRQPQRVAKVTPAEPTIAPTETLAMTEPTTEPVAQFMPEPAPAADRMAAGGSSTREPVAMTHQVTTRVAYGQLTMSLTTSQSMPVSAPGQQPLMTRPIQEARASRMADQPTTPQTDMPGLVPPARLALPTSDDAPDRLALNLAPLDIQPLSIRTVGNDRIVWYRTEQPDAAGVAIKTTTARTERRKAWVSAGVVAASFNPELALRSTAVTSLVPTRYQNNGVFMNSGSSISAHTGSAVAVQVNTGLPLGEHWAIETGVGYLSSQAGVQSPGRSNYAYTQSGAVVFDNGAYGNSTLYTDLISSRLSNNSAVYAPPVTNGLIDMDNSQKAVNYVGADQTVSNVYQFVQVPAQVSYEFRPRRKFGLALLTGFVSNWFVRNTVNQTVEVKANDGIYRPVTMAGTAGVRFRYRPDRHWSASMAGTFQQSLQSLTLNDVNIQVLPQQVGLSFSVDRHF